MEIAGTSQIESEDSGVNQANSIGLRQIQTLSKRSKKIVERLRQKVFAPDKKKKLNRRFPISEVAQLVGRTPSAIRDAEKDGRLDVAEKNDRGRRVGYTLEQINKMREVFGTLPWRDPKQDEVLRLSVQSFKGGVGKSTITVHLAQYLVLQGYRVCIIDCDPQASTTTLLGLNPDYEVDDDETLFPFFLHGEKDDLKYAVHDTYWPGLKLIPANLALYNAEYQLAARLPGNSSLLNRLAEGLTTIEDDFDVILMDPPPALGMLSLSVLRAANALIIPVPPSQVDFSSTNHFFEMLASTLGLLESEYGMKAEYKFVRVLGSRVNESKSAQVEITKMMQMVYENFMLDALLKDSAEIDNASARLQTVYELEGPVTSKQTHARCKAYLNAVNSEIELLIRKTWPSHTKSLRKQGLI